MRILQICPHYIPAYHYGGVLHVAHSLAKSLLRQGHEICVCTTNLKNPYDNLDIPINKAIDMDGIKIYYEPVILSRYWGFSPSLAKRIWKESQRADIIMIHFHYQFASIIAGWISRIRRKPYIIFTHGSLNKYSVNARSTSRKKYYVNLLEQGNFKNAFFTAYHSAEEMENSFQFGCCRVIPNGINPNEFENLPEAGFFREQYPETKDKILFLYLGRLDSGKGLDILIPAFQKLIEKNKDVHLILAGGNERGYEENVRQMIHQFSISNYVTLTGLISGQIKFATLQDADIFVLPSRGEGLSIAMLEAMYMGLPVIVSDRVGLWCQIAEQKAGLVVSLDIDKLADALIEMAENQNRKEMGNRGHLLVKSQYTWDMIAQNLIAEIQKVI